MNDLFSQVLQLAQRLDCYKNNGGMASLRVFYDPYDSTWTAQADWSSANKIQFKNCAPKQALHGLKDSLRVKLEVLGNNDPT